MVSSIVESKASGEQIQRLAEKLSASVDGENRTHIIMACLTFALTLMKDDLSAEDIQKGVLDTSAFICTMLADAMGEDGIIDKKKVN